MPDQAPGNDLAQHFRNSAVTSLPRAPLYAALSRSIAEDPDLHRLLEHAPPMQRLPVLLFAAIHAVLLEHPDDDLARWYPNLTDDPRPPTDRRLPHALEAFVATHHDRIVDLLATRSTQTNEVGRSSILLVALALVADETGDLCHLDVGASGGLNLLLDRYEHRYTPRPGTDDETSHPGTRTVGGPSTVVLDVSTQGAVPVPTRMPAIRRRCGIDRHPIDITDDDEAHWLEACVWADQTDRFARLAAAIDIARSDPPELLAGDATDSLAPVVERLAHHGHPVVTNSWTLSYFDRQEQIEYVAALDGLGEHVDLSWVFFESPQQTPGLPWSSAALEDAVSTSLSIARWRGGSRTVRHLARCHPHGYWMHWAG